MSPSDSEEAAFARARAKLLTIPGVAAVETGLKEAGGQILRQRVLRVSVAYKRPLAELTPEERIPAEIEGVATDVVAGIDRGDCSSLPTLTPGVQITRDNPGDFNAGGGGTLGLLVDLAGRRLLLSNDHVLWASSTHVGNRNIYSPELSGARECPCNRPAATIASDLTPIRQIWPDPGFPRFYYVDAQLADVVSGVNHSNLIEGIGPVTGGNDLSMEQDNAILGLNLRKRGMMSQVTSGTVVQVTTEDEGEVPKWEMRISNPTEGHDYDETFTLMPDQNTAAIVAGINTLGLPLTAELKSDGTKLRVFGKVLSIKGDSGSVCVDDAGQAVGLLYGMIGQGAMVDVSGRFRSIVWGRPLICFIRPVFDALGLTWPTSIVPVSAPAHGALVRRPAERVPWPDGPVMRELEAAVLRTPRGRLLMALAQRLYQQVASLVHHRRRVTVVWHRNRGPAFVNAFLRTVVTPDQRLPGEIGGVQLRDALARLRAALMIEGDAALREALVQHGDWVQALAARASSVPELLAALEEDG